MKEEVITSRNEVSDAPGLNDECAVGAGIVGRFLDCIGNFFKKMTIGIFKFLKALGIWLFDWKRLKDVFRFLMRLSRAIFWIAAWLFLVQAYFIIRDVKSFLAFWQNVWHLFLHNVAMVVINFIVTNAGVIWTAIALLGSVYGILHVTLKRRASKKRKEQNNLDAAEMEASSTVEG